MKRRILWKTKSICIYCNRSSIFNLWSDQLECHKRFCRWSKN